MKAESAQNAKPERSGDGPSPNNAAQTWQLSRRIRSADCQPNGAKMRERDPAYVARASSPAGLPGVPPGFPRSGTPKYRSAAIPAAASRSVPPWKLFLRNNLFALLLILLAGCTVGSNYHPPALKVPERWSEPLAGGETNGIASIASWWKVFADPELDSLVTRAVRANLQLRVARARVLEARAQAGVVAADAWPSMSTTNFYNRNRLTKNFYIPLPPGTPLNYNWYQLGFDAAWEVDVFGRTRRSVEAAKADIAAAEFNLRDTLVTLLAEMARNYFEARGYQQRLAIAQKNIDTQRDSLNLTRQRYQAGVTSELDVEQSSALLTTTEAQIPALETALKTSIHRLGVLLGEPPGALLTELSKTAPIPPPPPQVPVGLPSDLLQRRPDVQRAERDLAAATARIGVAKADLFPRFSLTGIAGWQSVTASEWLNPSSTFWTVGPTLTWRIFDAGRIRANIRVQSARQEQALASYEQAVLNAFEDTENALTAYAKEQLRARSLEASVASNRAALNLSQDLYNHGLADFLRVLESDRSLYQAEDDLVQSRKTIVEDLIALYKALGGGWAADDEGRGQQSANDAQLRSH